MTRTSGTRGGRGGLGGGARENSGGYQAFDGGFGGGGGGDGGGGDGQTVVCSCGMEAKQLTVRKEGPNQGILTACVFHSIYTCEYRVIKVDV